ncbi:MAG: CutA1 divalent ion tolerance protein-domain-containing protein [Monoraphidium minutum]|nr:MAG: CutA1 divalent ion tolerance protein-domain-containing protein [Monoraphidium minutum]
MSGSAAAAGAPGGGDSPTGAIVVYVTAPDEKTANHLSEALVSSHLAACVNIVPGLTSVYWWEGKVNRDSELLLVIKTKGALLGELTQQVRRLHPYDEPEVVALPITGGSPSYLQWLHASVAAPDLDALAKIGKLPS